LFAARATNHFLTIPAKDCIVCFADNFIGLKPATTSKLIVSAARDTYGRAAHRSISTMLHLSEMIPYPVTRIEPIIFPISALRP
jgi:hypothetical protein